MKNCVNCGAEIAEDAKFCPNCGAQQPETVNPFEDQQANTQANPFEGQQGQQNQGNPYGQQNQGSYQGNTYQQNQGFNQNGQYQQGYNPNQQYNPYQQPGYQPQKGLAIVSYLTWIGFIVALVAGDRQDPFLRFHLNQCLVLDLFALLGFVPVIGWIWDIFVLVLWIMGLVSACQGEMKEVPLLGKIHIL